MEVIGHRGAAALAPENTWPSFDRALDVGVDAIETDVRSTLDGQLILLHDQRLDRTTNGHGPVHETPWAVVKDLDAGSWFSPMYVSVRVPLLSETLSRYGRAIPLVLEIKQPGIELHVLSLVRQSGLLARITFTSFDFDCVARIKAEAAASRVGFLSRDTNAATVERVLAARLDQFCPPADAITFDMVRAWHDLGLQVRAWGVRDVTIMRQAIAAGVDGMTVDFPHLLLQALGRGRSNEDYKLRGSD